MARHVYVDPSKFRAPLNYPNLTLTGLGNEPLRQNWPPGRSYVDVSRFEAPYLDYQFQDNTLFGLGATASAAPAQPLPPALQAYLQTGMPMSSIKRDIGAATAQVPRLVYGIFALLGGYVSYKTYKRYKEDRKEWDKKHPQKQDGS